MPNKGSKGEFREGWQTGTQTGVADWDEDWDKFEDEGFTSVKELTLDVKNLVTPPKVKSKPAIKETNDIEESGKATASSNAETKTKMADNIFEEAGDSETKNDQRVLHYTGKDPYMFMALDP